VQNKAQILERIKNSVKETAPDATLILYGSYARGDEREDSDIDLLVLVSEEKLTRENEIKIKYPLYDIETDTGIIISPLVLPRNTWITRHRITPFYENVGKEGIVL
jgi:predicted nucleotidyltransferase